MDIGLVYMGARYYLPGVGRFVSADTIVPDPLEPQQFNRYSYTLNNPLKYTDPTGHCIFGLDTWICVAVALSAITIVVDKWVDNEQLDLQSNPAESEGPPNVVVTGMEVSAGLGGGISLVEQQGYHLESSTYAVALCECYGLMSPTAGVSRFVSVGRTDGETAADAIGGYSFVHGISGGPVGLSVSTGASPNPQADSNLLWTSSPSSPLVLAEPPGTTMVSASKELSVTPVSIKSLTCECSVVSEGYIPAPGWIFQSSVADVTSYYNHYVYQTFNK